MINTIKISVLALCLLVTSSMGTPVDSAPSPTITVRSGDTVVNAAGEIIHCLKIQSDLFPINPPTPTPDASCNNAGLAYAIQKHNNYDNDPPNYSNANIDSFKTAAPIQTGSTKKIGFNAPNPRSTYSIYGGKAISAEMIAVNHRGYFVPPVDGVYTISSKGADELAVVWIGDNAFNGRYTRDNKSFEQGYFQAVQTKVYKTEKLVAGKWYPFRVLGITAQGSSNLDITVVSPDGAVLISPTSTNAPFFVQFNCDLPSTKFQDFGKETA